MTARARDGIALVIFLATVGAIRLAWHPLGPWVSLGMAFASALVVMAVYRARPLPRSHDARSAEAGPADVLLRNK